MYTHVGRPDDKWPILVISLNSSADRRAEVTLQMQNSGLPFAFIDAIDGRSGLPAECEHLVDRKMVLERRGYPMSDGELACAISHRKGYLKVVEENLDGAIILEDDVILTDRFAQFVREKVYRKADLIQLCYYRAKVWRGPGQRCAGDTRMSRLSETPFTAAAYSISRNSADALLKATTPITERADWPCEITELGARLIQPRIVDHPPRSAAQSLLSEGRSGLIPKGFDFTAGYVKGWRRLISVRSWKSFTRNKLSRRIECPF